MFVRSQADASEFTMGVRSLRERGGRNFIQGDLTSRKIMDYAIRPIQRAGGGGGGGVVVLSAIGRFNIQ